MGRIVIQKSAEGDLAPGRGETSKELQVEETAGRDRGPQPKSRRVLHWIKRGLQVLVIVLLTLAIAGAIYQTIAIEIDQRQLGPPPARW
jgi:hypothetical protein